MTYGIFLGRCQPFHLGHAHAIHEIYRDGLTPLIVIGSSDTYDDRNPYSFAQRVHMVHLCFPGVGIEGVVDCPENDDIWWRRVTHALTYHEDRVFYTHTKWADRDMGTFYAAKCERVKRYVPYDLNIHATNIRANLHGNKWMLDGRVYRYLCRLEDQRGAA